MTVLSNNKKTVSRDLLVIIVLNIAFAVVSFLKDTLTANYLGTSGSADTLFAAFFLPDAVGFNIMGQSASLVLVPALVKQFSVNRNEQAKGIAYLAALFFLLVSVLVSLVLLVGGDNMLIKYISGGGYVDQTLSVTLLKLLLPIVYIVPVSYICIAFLNAQSKFVAAAVAPLIYNVFILIAVILSIVLRIPVQRGILIISAAISGSALLMGIYLLLAARGRKGRAHFRASLSKALSERVAVKQLGSQTMFLILIFTLYQSVLYFERFVANQVTQGGLSALNYAFRLAQFPIWVFIAALLVVLLPELSKHVALEDHQALYHRLFHAGLVLLVFIIPVSALLFMLRSEVLSVLFLRGAFGQDSLSMTSQILAGYSLAIFFQSFSYMLIRVYLVYGKMKRVFWAYLASSVATVIFDLAAYGQLGLWTIGIGACIGWFVNLTLLVILGDHEMKCQLLKVQIRMPALITVANVAAVAAALVTKRILAASEMMARTEFSQAFLIACLSTLVYFSVYIMILLKTKIFKKI